MRKITTILIILFFGYSSFFIYNRYNTKNKEEIKKIFQVVGSRDCSGKGIVLSNYKLLCYLLKGGNPNISYKGTPLLLKAYGMKGSLFRARLLIIFRADINATSKYGYTPLLNALANAWNHHVNYLISKGANVHVVTNLGDTTLHRACSTSAVSLDIVKLLVSNGVDPCLTNHKGKRAFNIARYCNYNKDVINFLDNISKTCIVKK